MVTPCIFKRIQAATSTLVLLSLALCTTQAGVANGPHHYAATTLLSSFPSTTHKGVGSQTRPPGADTDVKQQDLPSGLNNSSSTTFTPLEQVEHNRVWRVIQKCCSGCWSGAFRTYRPLAHKNELALVQPPPPHHKDALLNFRLQVDTSGAVGTWSVWNLERRGDQTVVPLRQTPLVRSTQVKIGFSIAGGGIILRIPRDIQQVIDDLQRLVFEIGFWDASMRRTTVVEYKQQPSLPLQKPWLWPFLTMTTTVPWSTQRRRRSWYLHNIIVIQMRRVRRETFVGNVTDPEAIRVLPDRALFHDLREFTIGSFQLQEVESIVLQTMARQKRTMVTSSRGSSSSMDNERRLIEQRIANAFDPGLSSDRRRIFRTMLPNQMLVSLPTSIRMKSTKRSKNVDIIISHNNTTRGDVPPPPPPLRVMLAHLLDDDERRNLQVVEITYDAVTTTGIAVTLYSLRR